MLTTILLVIYGLGVLLTVRLVGAFIYYGPPPTPGDIKPGNPWSALAAGIVHGLVWPLIVLVLALSATGTWLATLRVNTALGRLLFGKEPQDD